LANIASLLYKTKSEFKQRCYEQTFELTDFALDTITECYNFMSFLHLCTQKLPSVVLR